MGGTLETSGRVTRPVQMSEMVEEDGLGGGPRSQQSHPELPGARTRALAHTPARACTPGGNRKQRKRSLALMQVGIKRSPEIVFKNNGEDKLMFVFSSLSLSSSLVFVIYY